MEPQGPVGRAAAPAEGGARGWAGRCAGMHYGVCGGGTQVLRRGLEWDRPEGGKAGCSNSCAEQPRALGGAGGLVQLSGVDKSAKGFSGQGTVCGVCMQARARGLEHARHGSAVRPRDLAPQLQRPTNLVQLRGVK